jgi:hypothetical protein
MARRLDNRQVWPPDFAPLHLPTNVLDSLVCFLLPTSSSARMPVIALFLYLFTAFYAPGEGPTPQRYFHSHIVRLAWLGRLP